MACRIGVAAALTFPILLEDVPVRDFYSNEPTAADLVAIEVEWPGIQADIDALADPEAVDRLVDQIYELEGFARTELGRRRQRRRKARMTISMAALTAGSVARREVA